MKIISKYLLKEHVGPFVFAASALTSLMLLQYIARRFGDLVGKGLGWEIIAEFFVLSLPFTVAMTMPMAVLVAVLYAFSRLASENEVTALKAGGVSMRRLVVPVLGMGALLAAGMLFFNDQVLPRANHRLSVLQQDIMRTKPTFAIKEQIINPVSEGKLYMRASRIDEAKQVMHDVVIFDLSDALRRRTIYADSGLLAFAPNQKDLDLTLFDGYMQSAPTEKPQEITRLFFRRDRMRVLDVASGGIKLSDADSASKGDREMSVCEMQRMYSRYDIMYVTALNEYREARWLAEHQNGAPMPDSERSKARRPRTIGAAYCSFLTSVQRFASRMSVRSAEAAELPQQPQNARQAPPTPRSLQATDSIKAATPQLPVTSTPAPVAGDSTKPGATGTPATNFSTKTPIPPSAGVSPSEDARVRNAQAELTDATRNRNRYAVEIEKKFSLAATCVIFVLVGAPIALRFPRGGVGLVLGVSFFIFALYYVGLIGGEALADRGYLAPFWAMWGTNIIFLVLGLLMMIRMGSEATTARGGDFGELVQTVRGWIARGGRRAGIPLDRRTT